MPSDAATRDPSAMRAEQDTTGAGGSVRAGDPNVSAAGTRDGAPRLSGHIKSISRLAILGWAGDLDRPDHPVEILVTVNNRRPIRVTANPAVSSSATPGPHGAREHRFMLPFTPPLSTARDQRITVAFAETGLMLKGGEARIRAFTPDEIEARLSQNSAAETDIRRLHRPLWLNATYAAACLPP